MAIDRTRWIIPILLILVLGGILAPFVVAHYHYGVLQNNQNAAIDALSEFARLQNDLFAREGHYAPAFEELGGEWAKVQDLMSHSPTEFHGYRFRLFTAQSSAAAGGARSYLDDKGRMTGGYALMAVPAKYGFSGQLAFFISAPGTTVYYYDFGVRTDSAAKQLAEFYVPAGAKPLE